MATKQEENDDIIVTQIKKLISISDKKIKNIQDKLNKEREFKENLTKSLNELIKANEKSN